MTARFLTLWIKLKIPQSAKVFKKVDKLVNCFAVPRTSFHSILRFRYFLAKNLL